MTPDRVCELLSEIGANVSRRTLLHYEEQELIPKPERGGGGRQGRFSHYPVEAVFQAFAAWSFLHGKYGSGDSNSLFGANPPKLSPSVIRHFRKRSLSYISIEETREIINDIIQSQYGGDANKYYQEQELSEKEEKEREDYLNNVRKEEEKLSRHEKLKIEWNQAMIEASTHVNVAFMSLWEAEVMRAKMLLVQKELI